MQNIFALLENKYQNKYIISEALCCFLFSIITLLWILLVEVSPVFYIFFFLIFVPAGILWSLLLASIIGKSLFFLALFYFLTKVFFSELIYHLEIIFPLIITLLFLFRIFLLFYIPRTKNSLVYFLSRLEMFNRGTNFTKDYYYALLEKGDIEEISKLIAGNYEGTSIDESLVYAIDCNNISLVEFFLKMGADPLREVNEVSAVKKVVLKGDEKLLKVIMEYVDFYVEGLKEKNKKEPALDVYFLDEEKKLSNIIKGYNKKETRMSLQKYYPYFLKKNPSYWLEVFKRFFSGELEVLNQDTGHFFIISKHSYRSFTRKFREKEKKDQGDSIISMPVGLIRAKDKLESKLQNSFYHEKEGSYTFLSDFEFVACEKCYGSGLLTCEAGCKNGKVKCKNPYCKEGKDICPECSGYKEITIYCNDCKGRGFVFCDSCGGKGFIVCDECENGFIEVEIMDSCSCRAEWKVKCPGCQGTGKEKGYICTMCGGKKVICKMCNETGKIPRNDTTEMYCNKCEGTGKLRDCNCDVGFVKCSNCEGEREIINICPTCNGYGLANCSRCKGEGEEFCENCKGFGRVNCDVCVGVGKVSRFIYSKIVFEKLRANYEDHCVYLPGAMLASKFEGISAFYLEKTFKGKADLIRLISREELSPILDYEKDGEEIFSNINSLIRQKESREVNIFMESIDIMPLKYDVIYFSTGEKLVLIENEEPFMVVEDQG